MADILQTIIARKKEEVAGLETASLRRQAEQAPQARNFLAAIRANHEPAPRLIAELKRASPSKGLLAANLNLLEVADMYIQNGAAAISVLTDEKFFQGKLETLRSLRFEQQAALPLLRKDFIIADSQIFEARANGADAILLIVAALPDDKELEALHTCARSLGLTVLVEVHDEAETDRALRIAGLELVGINNRNLGTFEVSLSTSERLRPIIPPDVTVVAESGIHSASDVNRLAKAGVDGILVGEALVTAKDIASKVRELSSYREVS